MVNEAVIVELLGDPKGMPVSYTCADNVGIEKGTILWATERTVSGANVVGKPFAGIAAHEKVANDGSTHIGCWTCGIFDIVGGGTIAVGSAVVLSGNNVVSGASIANKTVDSFGRALEAGSNGEVIQIAVGIY